MSRRGAADLLRGFTDFADAVHYCIWLLLTGGLGDRWHWSTDVSVGVNFCIWALRADGLRVPPFDRHPDGDGALRAAGLTPTAWQAWLHAVLDLDARFKETSARGVWPPPRDLALAIYHTHTAWPGDPSIGVSLAELWPRYHAEAEAWKRRYACTEQTSPLRLSPKDQRRLWRQLKPVRRRLPPLRVYLVEYPAVVAPIVPPASMLLGTGGGLLDQADYAAAVLRGAQALASHRMP